MMRLAIALRRRVPVMQMSKKRPVGSTKVLPVEAERIEVEIVFESHQARLAVFGVYSWAGERSVEPIDRALREKVLSGRVRNNIRRRYDENSPRSDGQNRRRRERVLVNLETNVVENWVRQGKAWRLRGRPGRSRPVRPKLVRS